MGGPYPQYSLRLALNNAIGQPVVQVLALAGTKTHWGEVAPPSQVCEDEIGLASGRGDEVDAELALHRARAVLQGTSYELESSQVAAGDFGSTMNGWKKRADGATVRGLLFFEPPGTVTSDA